MSEQKSYRDASRMNWTTSDINLDRVNAGSLQRIADATEVMAKRHTELISERDQYKRWYEDAQARALRYERRITALKGVITKLKKGGEGQ